MVLISAEEKLEEHGEEENDSLEEDSEETTFCFSFAAFFFLLLYCNSSKIHFLDPFSVKNYHFSAGLQILTVSFLSVETLVTPTLSLVLPAKKKKNSSVKSSF